MKWHKLVKIGTYIRRAVFWLRQKLTRRYMPEQSPSVNTVMEQLLDDNGFRRMSWRDRVRPHWYIAVGAGWFTATGSLRDAAGAANRPPGVELGSPYA